MIMKKSIEKVDSSSELKKSKSEKPDKDFLKEIKKEIEDLDKELRRKHEIDDLNVSSDSSVKSSQELSSEFSLSESYQESPRSMKNSQIKTRVSLPNLKKMIPTGKSLNDKEKIRELEK